MPLLRGAALFLAVVLVAAAVSAGVYLRLRPAAIEGRGAPAVGAPAGNVGAAQRAAQSVVRVDTAAPASPVPGAPDLETPGGSGVVVDARGFILTAEAVVAGASRIAVAVPGVGVVDARVIGSDAVTSVTLLKVDTPALKPIDLAQGATIAAGSGVVVAGAPPAPQAMLAGISSPDVSVSLDDASQPGGKAVVNDLFSLDLTAPAATLGDAVVDANGRLVGLVVGAPGQAVASPVVDLAPAIAQLIENGHVTYPSIGARYQQLSTTAAAERGLAGGALVLALEPGGAAEAAGVKPGEVIVAAAGIAVDASHSLRSILRDQPLGQPVSLRVRDAAGVTRSLSVKLALAAQ